MNDINQLNKNQYFDLEPIFSYYILDIGYTNNLDGKTSNAKVFGSALNVEKLIIYLFEYIQENKLPYTNITIDKFHSINNITDIDPIFQQMVKSSPSENMIYIRHYGENEELSAINVSNELVYNYENGLIITKLTYTPLPPLETDIFRNLWAQEDLLELLFPNQNATTVKDYDNKVVNRIEDIELHTFFLIDAAMYNKNKRFLIYDLQIYDMPWRCLFDDERAKELEDVAPYLVDLTLSDYTFYSNCTNFHKRIFAEFLDKSIGIIIQSKQSIDDLASHFRKFTFMKRDEGENYFFRFYDPRICENILKVFELKQLAYFFSPVEKLFIFDSSLNLIEITIPDELRNTDVDDVDYGNMYEKLEDLVLAKFYKEAKEFIKIIAKPSIEDNEIEQFIIEYYPKAKKYLGKQRAILYFLGACWLYPKEHKLWEQEIINLLEQKTSNSQTDNAQALFDEIFNNYL